MRATAAGLGIFLSLAVSAAAAPLPTADGFQGIWYQNTPTRDQYVFKYSGGMATYPQQHLPIAIYAPRVNKTFFVYGGTTGNTGPGKPSLLHMISYSDHATGTVARPRILLDKKTDDAHDNPVLSIDADGYLYVFSNAHGLSRPAFIHKSTRPWSIDEFEKVLDLNFSYGQPWYVPGQGFLFFHTQYARTGDHYLYWMSSPDGQKWSERQPLGRIPRGHYQISWPDTRSRSGRIATVFDFHPNGLDTRTNLYYLETSDLGRTWKTVDGTVITTPLTMEANPALVRDYHTEKLNVYFKDVQFDGEGRPVILYLTSKGARPGPANGPYTFHTCRWTGTRWETRPLTTSDHNYDHGSLYLDVNGNWTAILPTEPGPTPFSTGGELVVWKSRDQGASWRRVRQLTTGSSRQHTYLRRPLNAHPDFWGLWADGDAHKPSDVALYFTNKAADRVWRLPAHMTGDFAKPELVQPGPDAGRRPH